MILHTMKRDHLTPVEPVSPVAPWLGGKRNLAKRITAILDTLDHQTYAERFVGMGGVFLRRKMRPRSEVINDFGRDVSNLFRILQRHYPQFLEVLRFQLTTRTEFLRLVETDPSTLTDLGLFDLEGGAEKRGSFKLSQTKNVEHDGSLLVPPKAMQAIKEMLVTWARQGKIDLTF